MVDKIHVTHVVVCIGSARNGFATFNTRVEAQEFIDYMHSEDPTLIYNIVDNLDTVKLKAESIQGGD